MLSLTSNFKVEIEFPKPKGKRLKPMKIRWTRLLVRSSIWLTAEMMLNSLGLDDVSDYVNFILEKSVTVLIRYDDPSSQSKKESEE